MLPRTLPRSVSPQSTLPQHAVCVTGLQRSFSEIASNVVVALASLYDNHNLTNAASFFGVRPANDSWHAVRAHMPPLAAESIQRPCGYFPPPWFSAYARTAAARHGFSLSFVQSLCDMAACLQLIVDYESSTARGGVRFRSLARLRLDLAWETPLRFPSGGLQARAVHLPRMNAKAGVNDKWALGQREPMAAYLNRVHDIAHANALFALHNKSAPAAALPWMHHGGASGEAMSEFHCLPSPEPPLGAFRCRPVFDRHTTWQRAFFAGSRRASTSTQQRLLSNGTRDAPRSITMLNYSSASSALQHEHVRGSNKPHQHPQLSPHRFTLTSEGFLQWALWRHNVSVVYEPAWMFCKFKDATNETGRVCVWRMRKAVPCDMLICQGSQVDCGCKNATSSAAAHDHAASGGSGSGSAGGCVHYDVRKHANATHWYCQDTRGKQLDLAGRLF